MNKKRKWNTPHTYLILISIIIIVYLISLVIPSGVYDRELNEATDRMAVVADSYHQVEKVRLSPMDVFLAFPAGLERGATIIFFIIIASGTFQMINATGAINVGVASLARIMRGKEILTIPVFVTVCSIGGATIGMSEETLLFIPIGVVLARSLGYDALVGMTMISLGALIGNTTAFMNPFSVGIAQEIAELPLYSGIQARLGFWAVYVIFTSAMLMRYAKKVKKDKRKSYVYDLEMSVQSESLKLEELPRLSGRQRGVLLLLVGVMLCIVYGVFQWGWYLAELEAVFCMLAIGAGIIGGFSPNKMCEEFIEGARNIVFGALLIGFAQTIIIVMENAQVIDTVIYNLSNMIMWLPDTIAPLGMYLVQTIINFFISSGSAQAMTTMPIMIPVADIIGMTRQTAIVVYQFGDGITNAIFPTAFVLMSGLSMTKIPYVKYLKFVAPIIAAWIIFGAIFIMICDAVDFGPF